MSKISAIVIAKNEENMIADCLDSVSFCDEIVVVDGGSDDRTAEVAKRMGANVFTFKSDDFSKLRNFGLSKARYEWVLYADADERMTEELRREINHLIIDNGRVEKLNAYFLHRKNFYFGSSKKNEWPHIEKLERFFRKDKLKGWRGELHERPIIYGKIGELDGYLLHYTHRDLTSMLNKTIKWSKVEAELRLKSNHPKIVWWRFLRVMFTAFFDWYIRQKGWKTGTVGLIESIYQMFSMFITYARLWEIQNKFKSQNAKVRSKT